MSTRRTLPPGARWITLPNGERRVELVLDIGTHPGSGARRQTRRRFRTVAEACDAHAATHSAVKSGSHVPTAALTLDDAADSWLAGKRNLKATTRGGYAQALEPVRAAYGAQSVQRLTKAQLDTLVTELMAGTLPRSDGRTRRPWTGRTVALMLHVLGQVLDDLVKQGRLARNVAALVERPRHRAPQHQTWTTDEVRAFLDTVKSDRLHVAWLLALYGLRRGEVAGLRWEHVDLDAATLSVVITRTVVNGQVIETDPKSEAGRRVLPLSGTLLAAFKDTRRRQAVERLTLGAAYGDSGFVVVDEAGRALHPQTLSARFDVLIATAGVRRIRLHDARHTAATLMHLAGEPVAVIAAWLGHGSAAFTMRTYAHSQTGALNNAAGTLDQVFGGNLVTSV